MKKTLFALVGALLLLTACNPNTPSAISVKNKIYKHPTAVQYLKFKADSVLYYGDFGNETLNNKTFAYAQKDEVVTVYTPTPEHLLAYEGFVQRGNTIYELFANTSDPNYQDHQPANPATFSLVGKQYAFHSTQSDLTDTLSFLTQDTVAKHSRPDTYYPYYYELRYPQIFIGQDRTLYLLTDTATIFCKSLERTYFLMLE